MRVEKGKAIFTEKRRGTIWEWSYVLIVQESGNERDKETQFCEGTASEMHCHCEKIDRIE